MIEAGTKMQFNYANNVNNTNNRLLSSNSVTPNLNKHHIGNDEINLKVVSIIDGSVYPLLPEGTPFSGHTATVTETNDTSDQFDDISANIDNDEFIYSIHQPWTTP